MPFIAPLIAAGAGALGIGAAAASFIGTVGAALVGVAASVAVNLIFKKKTNDASTISGVDGELKIGGDVPRQIIFGTAATAGHLVNVNSYGSSNSNEQEVYVLSDWECESLVGIIVDGEEKTLVPQTVVGDEDARFWVNDRDNDNGDTTDDAKHYGSKLEIRFYRGAAAQTADDGLVAHANPSGRWSSAHRGDGVCYVVVDKTYDADLFSGFPTFKFIVKGAKLYDWRLDSTAGGSGPHRWGDPTTWEWSENPAVCLYNYQRGFFRGGAILMGQGVPPVDLPLDLYTAAANVCDEDVELAAGGTEARYAVSAIASDDAQHRDVLEAFTNAMGGWLYERAGSYAPVAGAAQTVVATITDADLLLEGQVRVSRKRSRSALVNYISGSYTAPAELWETSGYSSVQSAENEDSDGERLGKSLDFPQITSKTRAERLALLRYNENRCQTTATIPLSLKHLEIEIGDWVRWNSARYGDRVYRVSDWALSLIGGSIGMQIGLSEISSDVYGWNPLEDEGAAITPGSPRIDGPLTRTVSGFVVQATTATSGNGEEIPALSVAWDAPADPTVIAVIVEYRRDGETVASVARSDTPEAGEMEITGILGGADYEVRATIATDPPRATSWTSWASVTTTATTVPVVIDTDDMVPSLGRAVEGALIAVKTMQADMLRETLARQDDRKRARSIGASVKTEVIERMTAADGALAARIDTVEASVEAASAAVVSEATARANADTAIASDVTAIDARLDTAEGSISGQATALSALSGRVTTAEGTITSQGSAITSLDNRLDTAEGTIAGQATAISGLSSTVTALDGDVTALASDVTAISATVDDATADGSIRFVAAADQTGALARFELRARTATGGGGTEASAAMTIEAISDGGSNVSQVKIASDRFYLVSEDGTVVTFAAVDGGVYIDNLQVRHTINIGADSSGGEILVWGA